MIPEIKEYVNANLAETLLDVIIFLITVGAAIIGLAGSGGAE